MYSFQPIASTLDRRSAVKYTLAAVCAAIGNTSQLMCVTRARAREWKIKF